MNKVITVNVFRGITVYLLCLFMGTSAGIRRRQAKVQFASIEYETIKHVLSRFLLSETFFPPRADVLAGSIGAARLLWINGTFTCSFIYLCTLPTQLMVSGGGERCNVGKLTQHSGNKQMNKHGTDVERNDLQLNT